MEEKHEHDLIDELPKHIVRRLKGITIGSWADEVLKLLPKNRMASDPKIVGKLEDSSLVVKWTYYGFTIWFERMATASGDISVYAVSKIEVNNEQRNSSGNKRNKNTHRKTTQRRRK